MTTKRLIGKLHKETAIVTMLVPLAARCLIASTSSHRNSKLSERFPFPINYPGCNNPDFIIDIWIWGTLWTISDLVVDFGQI